jgi:hypothetical protein
VNEPAGGEVGFWYSSSAVTLASYSSPASCRLAKLDMQESGSVTAGETSI